MRDILHYTTEDLENLTLEQYFISLIYVKNTYKRRDIVLIFEKMFGNKKGSKGSKGDLDFTIEHPDILEYIRKNQIVNDPEIKWSEIK